MKRLALFFLLLLPWSSMAAPPVPYYVGKFAGDGTSISNVVATGGIAKNAGTGTNIVLEGLTTATNLTTTTFRPTVGVASTVAAFNASTNIYSIGNGAGFLANDGGGAFTWETSLNASNLSGTVPNGSLPGWIASGTDVVNATNTTVLSANFLTNNDTRNITGSSASVSGSLSNSILELRDTPGAIYLSSYGTNKLTSFGTNANDLTTISNGTVTATTFSGALSGNASTATSATSATGAAYATNLISGTGLPMTGITQPSAIITNYHTAAVSLTNAANAISGDGTGLFNVGQSIGGAVNQAFTDSNAHYAPWSGAMSTATITSAKAPLSRGSTAGRTFSIQSFYCGMDVVNLSGTNVTFTILTNAVVSSVTCTVTSGAIAAQDLTHVLTGLTNGTPISVSIQGNNTNYNSARYFWSFWVQ